jgi:hypothetical protein
MSSLDIGKRGARAVPERTTSTSNSECVERSKSPIGWLGWLEEIDESNWKKGSFGGSCHTAAHLIILCTFFLFTALSYHILGEFFVGQ